MAPFRQLATLPIATGALEKALAIFRPFAEVVESTVPGCLEFALYTTKHNEAGEVDVIIVEHYVSSEAHDSFTASSEYQQMLQKTADQSVLRGAPILTIVDLAGGFTNRSQR